MLEIIFYLRCHKAILPNFIVKVLSANFEQKSFMSCCQVNLVFDQFYTNLSLADLTLTLWDGFNEFHLRFHRKSLVPEI